MAWPLIIAALLLNVFCRHALAQTSKPANTTAYVYESWTVADGLPVNGINGLLQSKDGYIWAATWDGLVRFDGVRFTTYNSAQSKELPSDRLTSMWEGADNALWLITEQGQLVRFQHGRFTHFGPERGLVNFVLVVYPAANGTVWVGTADGGVGRIQNDRYVPIGRDVVPGRVHNIIPRRDGSLWLYTEEQRGVYRVRDDRVERVRTGTALDTTFVYPALEDANGRAWLGTNGGLWIDDGKPRPVLLNGEPILAVNRVLFNEREQASYAFNPRGVVRIDAQLNATLDRNLVLTATSVARFDDEGRLWYISNGKLYRDGTLVYDLSTRREFASYISAFTVDREGIIWVATGASGLHRVKPALFGVLSEPEGLAGRNVYSVYEDGTGTLWAGMLGNGVSRIDENLHITNYVPGRLAGFASTFYSDRSDRLWVGTPWGLLACRLPEVACADPVLPTRSVYALYRDSHGRLWAGLDAEVAVLEHERWTETTNESLKGTRVRAFAETRDGALWLGTLNKGLLRYADGKYTRVGVADGMPSNVVRSLYEDQDGWLWIGTEGRGLARLDPRAWTAGSGRTDTRITRIGASNGLFDEVIHQILEDDAGRLWMNTNRGVFWVPRAELVAFAEGRANAVHSTSYNERDGIRNREGNGGFQPAGVKARDGKLWFPTQDGVVFVDPARITSSRTPPAPVIERVVVGDTSFVPQGKALALSVQERDLQIEYTAPTFLEPRNVRFRYRLDPYDPDWVDAGNRRTAFYTRVPPGKYQFHVIASSSEGVWSAAGPVVDLSLAYHFWETSAFRLSALIALLLIAAAAVRWRDMRLHRRALELEHIVTARTSELRAREHQLAAQNEQLESQAEQLQELDRAKSSFFANVSHEFRTPLTLTIGPLEDAQAKIPEEHEGRRPIEMALRNSRRLLRLVNQILDVAKLDAAEMKLRPRELDLVPFTRGIANAFAPLAESRGIRLSVDTPPALPGSFDADALEKILTNLISNAVKFTPQGGEVAVTLSQDSTAVTLRVSDTGPGISAEHLPRVFDRFYQVDESHARAQPGTGIGLALVKELVKLHGGSIRVESGTARTGATFVVVLPLLSSAPHPGDGASQQNGAEGVAVAAAAEIEVLDARSHNGGAANSDVATMLVVDDSADLRAYVAGHFARRFRVLEAADGAEGAALARTQLPDVIVSDVMMPGADGHELVRRLRASPETDFIPIILLTAQATTEHRIAGLERGADDYIAKPFEMRELEARVDNVIAAHRRLREHYTAHTISLKTQLPTIDARDQALLERVRAAIQQHLGEPDFGVTELAAAVFQDRSHLYRRINELLGETPSDLIRRLRLEHAQRLLAEDAGTIADVAYASGFNSVSWFCRCFRDAYELTPSEFRAVKAGN